MKPQDDYRNGDARGWSAGGGGSGSSGSEEEGSEGGAEEELSLEDAGAPARALAALNALRKSRQHFDCVLVAEGAEVAAHRAVLAAASPYLLEALAATPPAGPVAPVALRVEGVDAEALRTLVEYAYTGRARVREGGAARRLYLAAWRLRVEPVRAHLAERLARRARVQDCLATRALPDLEPHLLTQLDTYIAANFDEICEIGALATLPKINIEMLRESSAEDGEETAVAVAEAALAWLRDKHTADDLEELCSRTHLLFVDAGGALRDCGELPAATDHPPALVEYRREAAERLKRAARVQRPPGKEQKEPRGGLLELGARTAKAGSAGACAVIAAHPTLAGTTRALVLLRGRLAAVRVVWRNHAAGAGVTRGGVLNGAKDCAGDRLASLAMPRCAHGTAAFEGRLVVCGGYDRARVLRSTEAYDPVTNTWSPLPDMRGDRARFPAAICAGELYALGGSDGHTDLDSVDVLRGGSWVRVTRLPLARTHAAAAAAEGALYVLGGWAGGLSLRRVDRLDPARGDWTEAPPLNTGRSQCAGVVWERALWVLGGCDAWHCLASTETLPLDDEHSAWQPGPALPTARRSVGGAVWRGRLVSAGGSDGAASLRRTDWLHPRAPEWRPGPDLRRARAALGLQVLEDVLYAVGGFDGKEFLSCAESLREPDQPWTELWVKPAVAAPGLSVSQDTPQVKENGEAEAEPVE